MEDRIIKVCCVKQRMSTVIDLFTIANVYICPKCGKTLFKNGEKYKNV
jgi:hypothetical protein